jgi:RecB family endonuclease NucS
LKVVPGSNAGGDGDGEGSKDEGCSKNGFAAEAHLRDYLALHLGDIEEGLELYIEDDGTDGIEYITEVGRIDILAVDKGGALVVVELKVDQAPDTVVGQLMRYMGWLRRHLANGRKVRGFIIGQSISDKIRYATADLPDVELQEYELSLKMRPVPRLSFSKEP